MKAKPTRSPRTTQPIKRAPKRAQPKAKRWIKSDAHANAVDEPDPLLETLRALTQTVDRYAFATEHTRTEIRALWAPNGQRSYGFEAVALAIREVGGELAAKLDRCALALDVLAFKAAPDDPRARSEYEAQRDTLIDAGGDELRATAPREHAESIGPDMTTA
jgi:hypothetical protein